jgi:hypothetical protein
MLAAAKKAKCRFDDVRRQIEKYDYDGDTGEDKNVLWDEDITFRAKVHKTQQFKREVGARLYVNNPTFRSEPRKWAGEQAMARSNVIAEYLNYCSKENGLFSNVRSCMNDALGPGRGVVWYGLHAKKSAIAVAEQDGVENLFIDPDATKWENVKWVARRRVKPKWELADQYEKSSAIIYNLPAGSKPSDENYDGGGYEGVDLVVYYEFYLTVGLHNYKGGLDESVAKKQHMVKDAPRKYVVSESMELIDEGDWEIPFHLDGEFPCDILDFYDHPKSAWPISPLEPGLGWQRAINWVSTMIIAKYKWSCKSVLAFLQINGVELDEQEKARLESVDGSPLEIVELAVRDMGDGNYDIRKYMQQINFTSNVEEALQILEHLGHQFEQETGLNAFLYYGAGPTQDRSAAATEARATNSLSRIQDMQNIVDDFMSRIGRKQAMTARYLLDPEDVEPIVGPEGAQLWGYLFTQEQLTPQYWVNKYTNEGIDFMSSLDMAENQVSRGTSLEQWLYEIDYTIEGGSTQRTSPQQERDGIRDAFNTVLPSLIQSGANRSAGMLVGKYAKTIGLSEEDVSAINAEFAEIQQQQQALQQQQMQEQQMLQQQGGMPDAAL